MTLNLKSDAGKEMRFRLVETADVVIENFRPDVKHRLGIDGTLTLRSGRRTQAFMEKRKSLFLGR